MKKLLMQGLVKNAKNIKIFAPNNVRLSFYIAPLGDVSTKTQFNEQDLLSISSWHENNGVNLDLFEHHSTIEEGNILALLQEGVIEGVATGADLGIYDYPQIVEKPKTPIDYSQYLKGHSKPIDSEYTSVSYFDNSNDYFVRNCVLAEENPLNGNGSKVVFTFTGYLEVTKADFSIIRSCDCDKRKIEGVYIPNEYIYKYQLRHGDEIVCTCKNDNGKMLLDSLFSINQVSRRRWEPSRPWFNNLATVEERSIAGADEYMKAIVNKFGLYMGDNVFIYLTKTTQKQSVLIKFIKELNMSFDKIIYINPNYKSNSLQVDGYNVTKFTTLLDDSFNAKVTNVLLATQYAKRLIEMGKKVAILIDDIEAIANLNKEYSSDEAIIKTVFGTVKVCELGACTSFSLVSLRTGDITSIIIPPICKSIETLGIIVDNNEIDLFNSYRI